MERLALFDLDGTLFDGRVWQVVVGHHLRHRVKLPTTLWYIVRNTTRMGLYKIGLIDQEPVWECFGREIHRLFGGFDEQQLAPMLDHIYDEGIKPGLDQRLLARWQAFGAEGYRRCIISASPQPLLTVIGRELGADIALGTHSEQRDGSFTGQITGRLCQADEKARRLRQAIAERGWQVDWPASYSFADSGSDRSILELAGHPVAIRPDDQLRAHAVAQGWEVMKEL